MPDTTAALLLFFQMIMEALIGGWVVELARPILIIFMTLVTELYYSRTTDSVAEEKSKE